MVEITKEKFEVYEEVRKSGVTGMFNLTDVMSMSGFSIKECFDIMENYGKYASQYLKKGI